MEQAVTEGRMMRELKIGEDVFCRHGDGESVLAPTHQYKITEMRRNAAQRVEVRVQNSIGEDMPGWFPIWPHFEPYAKDPSRDHEWIVPHNHNGAKVEVSRSGIGHGYILLRVSSPDHGEVALSPADWTRIREAVTIASRSTTAQ